MSEPLSDDAFTVRSITVAEVMNTDGELLEGAGESVRMATRNMWSSVEEDD